MAKPKEFLVEIEEALLEALPGAEIVIKPVSLDERDIEVRVIAEEFEGVTPSQQQEVVREIVDTLSVIDLSYRLVIKTYPFSIKPKQ